MKQRNKKLENMEKTIQQMIDDQRRTTGNRILNPDIKYWDFFFLTEEYKNTLDLTEEQKHQIACRINGFVRDIGIAIATSFCEDAQGRKGNMGKRISNCARKIKISLAKNKAHSDQFAAYWNYLLQVMKEDAVKVKNFQVNHMIGIYEQKFNTLQAA